MSVQLRQIRAFLFCALWESLGQAFIFICRRITGIYQINKLGWDWSFDKTQYKCECEREWLEGRNINGRYYGESGSYYAVNFYLSGNFYLIRVTIGLNCRYRNYFGHKPLLYWETGTSAQLAFFSRNIYYF